ncbi:MAG: hypothetical protein AABY86_06490, partial [Bdellovibrionota bacterium]
SFDVIRFFKKKFNLSRHIKIGHFGTLDPFAEGLLLVGLGRSLKLMPFVHELCPKSYLGLGSFGVKTLSGDYTGETVASSELWAKEIIQSEEEIFKRHAQDLVGKYLQARPYFSAAKVNGIPLYEYARRGEFIDVAKVERSIYEFEIIKRYPGDVSTYPGDLNQLPVIAFRTLVGTGTYVRTLFEDYCALLGGIGHLVALFRDKIGPIGIEHALKIQDLESYERLEQLEKYSLDPLQLLPLEQLWPDDSVIQKLKWGQKISVNMLTKQLAAPYAWAIAKTESGPSIVGLLQHDATSFRLVLHWDPDS